MQVKTGKPLASMFLQIEVSSMCDTSKLKVVEVWMANHYLEKIRKKVGPRNILETYDPNGITYKGYNAIYNQFKDAMQAVGIGLQLEVFEV